MADNTSNPTGKAPVFVDGLLPDKPEAKGPPKLYHKKSRTGCQRCRARRVKCNEVHPVCGNCQRHKLECVYDRQKPQSQSTMEKDEPQAAQELSEGSSSVQPTSESGSSSAPRATDSTEPPESTDRRYLELRLLHQFIFRTGPSIASDSVSQEIMVEELPGLALDFKGLLYAMYTITALHLVQSNLGNADINTCFQTYFDLALRHHATEVAIISGKNVDAICLTSSLLRVISFVMMQTRPLEPYTPPMQFLRVTNSATKTFEQAWYLVRDNKNSSATRLMARMPLLLDEEAKFGADKRQGLLHLLERSANDEATEPWTAEIQEAYETSLSFIGGIWISMTEEQESPAAICRRTIVFPMMIRGTFIDLVEEQRPRALVIFAHYFALLSMFQNVWWIGGTGPREVRAIQSVLPKEWEDFMSWPLQTIEQQIIYT